MTPIPVTIIAFGRSGSGKGTQLKLLSTKIEELKNTTPLNFATGEFFRDLFSQDTFTAKTAEIVTANGKLQPLFLTVSMWGNAFINNLKEDSVLFIDGFPRRLDEAKMLAEALDFYGRKNIVILDFLVSRETSKDRMLKRGRADDTEENAEIRLDWYDTDVVSGLDYLKNLPGYTYLAIDGERTVEDIHADVVSKIESYL
jgi:adenylate kinase